MIKIKKEYADAVIAFGSNGAALKDVDEAGLLDLAIIAQDSQDPTILQVFESPLPSLAELREGKMKALEVKAGETNENKSTRAPRTTRSNRPADNGS